MLHKSGPESMWPEEAAVDGFRDIPRLALRGPTAYCRTAGHERVSHFSEAVPFAGQRIDDGLRDRMCGG